MTIWVSRDAYDAFAPVFARVMKEQGFQFGQPAPPFIRFFPVLQSVDAGDPVAFIRRGAARAA